MSGLARCVEGKGRHCGGTIRVPVALFFRGVAFLGLTRGLSLFSDEKQRLPGTPCCSQSPSMDQQLHRAHCTEVIGAWESEPAYEGGAICVRSQLEGH